MQPAAPVGDKPVTWAENIPDDEGTGLQLRVRAALRAQFVKRAFLDVRCCCHQVIGQAVVSAERGLVAGGLV